MHHPQPSARAARALRLVGLVGLVACASTGAHATSFPDRTTRTRVDLRTGATHGAEPVSRFPTRRESLPSCDGTSETRATAVTASAGALVIGPQAQGAAARSLPAPLAPDSVLRWYAIVGERLLFTAAPRTLPFVRELRTVDLTALRELAPLPLGGPLAQLSGCVVAGDRVVLHVTEPDRAALIVFDPLAARRVGAPVPFATATPATFASAPSGAAAAYGDRTLVAFDTRSGRERNRRTLPGPVAAAAVTADEVLFVYETSEWRGDHSRVRLWLDALAPRRGRARWPLLLWDDRHSSVSATLSPVGETALDVEITTWLSVAP